MDNGKLDDGTFAFVTKEFQKGPLQAQSEFVNSGPITPGIVKDTYHAQGSGVGGASKLVELDVPDGRQ